MAKIYCEHEFCRYWNDNHCSCDEIQLGCGGICQSQILIDIDCDYLAVLRERDLKKEEKYWK